MGDEPKTVRVRARDVKPYHFGLWCSIEDGKPFVNEIVSAKWADDGSKLWFVLESHNFQDADPDEELDLVPLKPEPFAREKYGSFTLPPRPEPKQTVEQLRAEIATLTARAERAEAERDGRVPLRPHPPRPASTIEPAGEEQGR